MPRTITVETELNANYPDEEAFRNFGGPLALQVGCGVELSRNGCAEHTITFGEPFRDGDVWKMRGTGIVEDGHDG